MNHAPLQRTAYGRYARALARICKEESVPERQGYEIVMVMAAGTSEQKALAQDALDRWRWPSLMMFGPPDDNSPNSEQLIRWRVKRDSNDALRQRFIDVTVPQAEFLGFAVPDPEPKWDVEGGRYDFGEIDWEEFHALVRGESPTAKGQIKARRDACENGAWVGEAANSHEAKRLARLAA